MGVVVPPQKHTSWAVWKNRTGHYGGRGLRETLEQVSAAHEGLCSRRCESPCLARAPRPIACVDDVVDCAGEAGFATTTVMRFCKRIDAGRLVELAESRMSPSS